MGISLWCTAAATFPTRAAQSLLVTPGCKPARAPDQSMLDHLEQIGYSTRSVRSTQASGTHDKQMLKC